MPVGRIAGVTPEETKERLLAAAAHVFAERGFEGARITDITGAADLSSGAIYAHYASKAELLADVIRARGANELGGLFDSDEAPSAADLLVLLGSALVERDRAHGTLVMEAIVAARRDPEVAALMATGVRQREALLTKLVRKAQRDGELDASAPAAVVGRFSLMLTLGSLLVGTLDLPPVDPGEWRDFIARVVDQFRTDTSEEET